ncbi:Protein of unknown function [Pyronema omphalodes CBS 100304]|uniref:Uncharacterized protein n=1 Tax=Pyronema omphalodes (strain CBS 100304) TaxID=1076935 RepID=U4LUB8_PYROM|nr:Protein of unknown function [Pyronema omphalodes CBS 100304]
MHVHGPTRIHNINSRPPPRRC